MKRVVWGRVARARGYPLRHARRGAAGGLQGQGRLSRKRAKWPGVEFVADVGQVMQKAEQSDKVFLMDVSGANTAFNQASSSAKPIALIVGPEGGFTEEEVKQFQSLKNLQAVSLGPVLLRAETAALSAISLVRNLYI